MDGSLHGRHPPSLRRRLLGLVTVTTLMAWSLSGALIYHQARHDVEELMDGHMAETAKVLLAQGADVPVLTHIVAIKGNLRGMDASHNDMTMEFQLSRADGTVLLRTAHSPSTAEHAGQGYANIQYAGIPWRSLILETDNGDLRVQVAHPAYYRDKEAFEIAWNAILPLALMLPVLILFIYFSIRGGLKPLDNLAADVASRSPENLGTLHIQAAPLEARPLVKALNQLLRRLTTTIENERRFTADAAHELRTPLAALKIQAQIASAAKDPEQNRRALAQVLVGVDRATRLVEQLLRLARLDPIVKLPNPQPVDLSALAESSARESQSMSTANGVILQLQLAATPTVVSGDPDLLAIALRNLVDNALRYTPAGTTVTISVGHEQGEPIVAVTDNGQGVPAEELHLIVERFYRGSEAGDEGSGLGLAIVRRIAELHGAQLEVESVNGNGFTARIRWCGVRNQAGM